MFKADKRLMEVAKKSAKEAELDVKIFEGKVVSGDQFIGTAEKKNISVTSLAATVRKWKGHQLPMQHT